MGKRRSRMCWTSFWSGFSGFVGAVGGGAGPGGGGGGCGLEVRVDIGMVGRAIGDMVWLLAFSCDARLWLRWRRVGGGCRRLVVL